MFDSRSPSLDILLCTTRRLLRFKGSFSDFFFTCFIRKNMIWVTCTFTDYCTKDGSGRHERRIFNIQCSVYFFYCVLSSFCRKTRKRNCSVNFVLPSAFSSSIFAIILPVNDPFPYLSQSRSGLRSCKFSHSSDTHHRNMSCLSYSKYPS